MTPTKAEFLARVQAEKERKKVKPKTKTRQPINDYSHEKRSKYLRKVARQGGRFS